ncbi:DEAD/DEAH box helicase [Pseudofrankia saprophytica]|nr:DEAD/DEAH box helicase [Pseudofrankia saprophytica]OHV37039.1 helicase SNF2 [Pseudofrankia sp. EUN1h]
MARTRAGTSEARHLLDEAEALRALVERVLAGERETRTAVWRHFRDLRARVVRRDLGRMDLARLKDTAPERLQLRPLETAGYRTVGDIVDRTPADLSRLPGVGLRTATAAIAAAGALAEAAEDSRGIRIELDPADARSTDLLTWLRRAVLLADAVGPVRARTVAVARSLPGALSDARPARSRTRMFFAGAQSRAAAQRGLDEVSQILVDAADQGGQGLARELASAVALLDRPPGAAGVWTDFERQAVQYYGLLGEIVGNRGDLSSATGHLPTEIVDRVRNQPLDGTLRTVSLRGYQAFGAKFALVQRRVILGDEMGLGKTIQAIAAIAHLRAQGESHFLVVCPASVLVNWMREITDRGKLTVHRLHGADRATALPRWTAQGGVGVTTFDTLASLDLPAALAGRSRGPRIAMLVADEAHYVKNSDTRRADALRALIERPELVDRVLFLTGTPMENRLDEFQTLVGYLQPGLLDPPRPRSGDPAPVAVPGSWPGVAAALSPRQFRERVAPAYLRRNTADVLSELPERVWTDEWEELHSPAERAAYRDAVLSRQFMAMRRVAFTADPERSRKLGRLVEIAREAAGNGQRVVVFSFFHDVLDLAERRLRAEDDCGQVFGTIKGAMAPDDRQRLVDAFGRCPAPAVLLSQIVAGGTGLNMQAASVVVLCEPQVKPTLEEQAVARLHRMGQVRTVRVHRLLTVDSVDQRLVQILAAKRSDFDAYARRSDLVAAGPEAVDVSDEALTRQVVEQEYARMARAAVSKARVNEAP